MYNLFERNKMYDTVNLWLDSSNAPPPSVLLQCLQNVTESQNEARGHRVIGNANNYAVTAGETGMSLHGSLAKYLFGENVSQLTRANTQEAIERLSDHLHADIGLAKVLRLDVAATIPTDHAPADYLQMLGTKRYFTRVQATANSLYYNTEARRLEFYDKAREARFASMKIPTALQGLNLLRYEYRLMHRLQHTLKAKKPPTAADLYNAQFYYKLVQMWGNEFTTINKLNNSFMIDNATTPKEAKDLLLATLLHQTNDPQQIIEALVSQLKRANKFSDRKAYSRLKSELQNLLKGQPALTDLTSPLVVELQQKINDFVKYAR